MDDNHVCTKIVEEDNIYIYIGVFGLKNLIRLNFDYIHRYILPEVFKQQKENSSRTFLYM